MTFAHWRLDLLAHGERMLATATERTGDANEAHLLVHDVMARAVNGAQSTVSRQDLDDELERALGARAAARNR
jgi:hypothetical protein